MKIFKFFSKNKTLIYIILGLLAIWKIKDILSIFDNSVEEKKTIGSTISNENAKQRAEDIYNALGIFDDDEPRIYNALTGINLSDYNKIYNAYGKRLQWSINRNENTSFTEDLTETLKLFLQPDELSYLVSINPFLKPLFY